MQDGTNTKAAGKAILWSADGEVACQKHAPIRNSDTWKSGGWTKAPAGEGLECEHCAGVSCE